MRTTLQGVIKLGGTIALLSAASICSAQQVGITMLPSQLPSTTILIESMDVMNTTKFLPASNMVAGLERLGTNTVLVPSEGLFRQIRTKELRYRPLGSGVVLGWNGRIYVATASHVIPDTEDVYFRLPQKEPREAEHRSHLDVRRRSGLGWIRSTNADVAITAMYLSPNDNVVSVPLDPFGVPYERIDLGEDVFVIGYPASVIEVEDPDVHVVRTGIIAAKLKNKRIIIDAFTFPGNSGGPVFWKPSMGITNTVPPVQGRVPGLVGIVTSSRAYVETATSPHSGRQRIVFEDNSGLTEIVSTSRILELLAHPQITAAVARWDAGAERAPTAENGGGGGS